MEDVRYQLNTSSLQERKFYNSLGRVPNRCSSSIGKISGCCCIVLLDRNRFGWFYAIKLNDKLANESSRSACESVRADVVMKGCDTVNRWVVTASCRTGDAVSKLCAALTWWNGHVRTLGHDAAYAMTWGTFKKKLSDKYCPNGEIKKLEIELWNLKVKGNDVSAYTQHFQELALMCTKFLADETAKIDKYIGGLPDNIHGNVMSTRPKTLDFAIELANDLMDQKLRTYAERQNENKRKADDSSRNNHQQQSHKRQNVARAYTVGHG
ncbi:reverse transcriptase domain-containing protein, partial [Tanacetum coccineum]